MIPNFFFFGIDSDFLFFRKLVSNLFFGIDSKVLFYFYFRSAHSKTLVDLDETQSLTALELGDMYIGETETNQLCSIHFYQNGVNRAKLISFCLCDIQIAQFKRREGLRFG